MLSRLPILLLLALLLAACDSAEGEVPNVSGVYTGFYSHAGAPYNVHMTLSERIDRSVTGLLRLTDASGFTEHIGLTGEHDHPNLVLTYTTDEALRFTGTVSRTGRRITGRFGTRPEFHLERSN